MTLSKHRKGRFEGARLLEMRVWGGEDLMCTGEDAASVVALVLHLQLVSSSLSRLSKSVSDSHFKCNWCSSNLWQSDELMMSGAVPSWCGDDWWSVKHVGSMEGQTGTWWTRSGTVVGHTVTSTWHSVLGMCCSTVECKKVWEWTGDTGILLTICPLWGRPVHFSIICSTSSSSPPSDGDEAGDPPLILSINPIFRTRPPHQSHWEGIKFTGDACFWRNPVCQLFWGSSSQMPSCRRRREGGSGDTVGWWWSESLAW